MFISDLCVCVETVVVCEDSDVKGIFTSKDLMRRVVSKDIDSSTCPMSSVMTADPHSATPGTTILETLHSMHNGQFLHMPVFGDDSKLVGLVDVLQVSCGVIQQMSSFQESTSDGAEPLWSQFRSSLNRAEGEGEDNEDLGDATFGESSSRSAGGDVGSDHANESKDETDVTPGSGHESWSGAQESHRDEMTNDLVPEESPPDVFVYKLADCYGNNHRFTSSAESLSELLRDVQGRLGDHTIRRVHYVDDEGDHVRKVQQYALLRLDMFLTFDLLIMFVLIRQVLLFHDADLKDAVHRARMWGNKYIRLLVPRRLTPLREHAAVRRAFAHSTATDNTLGIVYYAAAAAAIAGASFFLSRRK